MKNRAEHMLTVYVDERVPFDTSLKSLQLV
jgi:hypothetical protein